MRTEDGVLLPLEISHAASRPLYEQVYAALRDAIAQGRLSPGLRLPSTRGLAEDLGVSRTTAIQAYRQLRLEGYVESDERSGTFVAHELPTSSSPPVTTTRDPAPHTPGSLSERGDQIVRSGYEAFQDGPPRPFTPGVPAIDAFPKRLWLRVQREVSHLVGRHLGPGDPAGHPWLRTLIAQHLSATRAIGCSADQVLITSGTQEALSLLAELLLDPGDAVLIEDPSYLAAERTFAESGATTVPVPVDASGMKVARGIELAPGAQLAYVTPAHQFPLGSPLSPERQQALLAWARSSGAWIIEDGYDSEYRFHGGPLPAMLSLDGAADCVVYVGTFNRIMFPALALGFVVLPAKLVDPFVSLRSRRLRSTPLAPQLAMAAFMEGGHYARHVRRMRTTYGERGEALFRALQEELGHYLEPEAPVAGMHLLAWLPKGVDDHDVSARAARAGIDAPDLARLRMSPGSRGALILGFGTVPEQEALPSVRKLALAINGRHTR